MKKLFLILPVIMSLFSCAPVLRVDLMKTGTFDARLQEIKDNPETYKGQLFILGGIIAGTTATEKGSMIEALYVPVNSRGYLKWATASHERFLAVFSEKFLEPLIFSKGREVTLAGEFVEVRKGRIEEMEYTYPLFEIKELYLWEERKDYYYVEPPYPYWNPPYLYWWYEPRWRHRH